MTDYVVKLKAVCNVISREDGNECAIYNNSRPNFFLSGEHYVCSVITDKEETLEPGSTGMVSIRLVVPSDHIKKDLAHGINFELRGGPNTVARCVIEQVGD